LLALAAVASMGAAPPGAELAAAMGLGAGFSLDPTRVATHLDQRIVVLGMTYRGLPVFLDSCAVQLDPAGELRRVSACTAMPPSASTGPRDEAAERLAAQERAEADGLVVLHAESGWLEGFDGRLEPVIRVEADGGYLAGEPAAIFYDATSLVAVHAEPLLETATAGGLVFPDNPVTTPEPVMVELTGLDEPGSLLVGARARVVRCVDAAECLTTVPTAHQNKEGDFVYAPDLDAYTFDDPFAEVNVYHNVTRFADWLEDELGWTGMFLDHGWIHLKVGIAWYNAAYYGGNSETAPFLIFGQDTIDFAYDADVACHEYGHAVNRTLRTHAWYLRDAFGIDTSPTGIEEGFADIWAQTYLGDPVSNAYVTRSRSADNDLRCPDALEGEGHYEARIISGFGWDVRERIGADAWAHVVYRTLPFLPSDAVFADLVGQLATSAADLAAEGVVAIDAGAAAVVTEEGEARGLLDAACAARFVPLEEGVSTEVYGYGRAKTNKRDRPFGVQWVLAAPEGAAAFRLEIDWLYPDEVAPGYRVHISRGAPVLVTWLDPDTVPEGEKEFEVDADLTIEGAPPRVDFPEAGLAPLAPGEQVYLLFSADTDESTIVLAAKPFFLSEQPPADAADAGVGVGETTFTAAAAPYGAGCHAAPRSVTPSGLLAALLP
jgi:hypothetical protein